MLNEEIDDNYIINYFYGNKEKINVNKYRNISDNIINYLNTRYNDSDSIVETINRIKYNIEIRPVCEECGGHVKYKFLNTYSRFCCYKCSANNKLTRQKCINTCLDRYGVINGGCSDEAKEKIKQTTLSHYGVECSFQSPIIQEKIKQTNIEKYGTEYYIQSDIGKQNYINNCLTTYGCEYAFQRKDIINKIKETKYNKYGSYTYVNVEKAKLTNLERYGETSWTKCDFAKEIISSYSWSEEANEKRKNTCLERYGVDTYSKSKEFNIKRFNSMKMNNNCGCNKSKQEDYCYSLLFNKFSDAIHHYMSSEYPFDCDFYIPEINTYIECNYHWTHGGHWFDENNKDDIDKLNKWKEKNTKYYNNAINTWTIRDVKKKKIVEDNNLNFLVFWNVKEFENWIKEYE